MSYVANTANTVLLRLYSIKKWQSILTSSSSRRLSDQLTSVYVRIVATRTQKVTSNYNDLYICV